MNRVLIRWGGFLMGWSGWRLGYGGVVCGFGQKGVLFTMDDGWICGGFRGLELACAKFSYVARGFSWR